MSSRAGRAATELVGRDSERTWLAAAVEEAQHGRARAVAARFPPGSGASALLADAAVGAADAGAMVVTARGLAGEHELAYAGLTDVCRPMLEPEDEPPGTHARSPW